MIWFFFVYFCSLVFASEQWTPQESQEWYRKNGVLVGCNYIPHNAINQIEMFSESTFDIVTIRNELILANNIGFNNLRVFLHNFLYDEDPSGFLYRLDQFLTVASSLGLKTTFVLFDSCWDANPHTGTQRPPIPWVHNSGWIQAPGLNILSDPSKYDSLKSYVVNVVSRFANDSRVSFWDIYNEPDNMNRPAYLAYSPLNKADLALQLIQKSYQWIRNIPFVFQPITSGVWTGDFSNPSPLQKFQLEQSDIISFHNYDRLDQLKKIVSILKKYNRPLINTEYMARPVGSTFNPNLGWMVSENVSAHNWGFVNGKTNTQMPWDSWCIQYNGDPPVWFHDIYRADSTPYLASEIAYIKSVTKNLKQPK